MYPYRRKNKLGAGSIFFMVIFILIIIGSGYLFYTDEGMFWDYLPFISIPVVVISLILAIFNFVKKIAAGFIFIIFFIIFTAGIIMPTIFGPSAIYQDARQCYENKDYTESIDKYKIILNKYPNSKIYDEALRNISLAYYSNNDYEEAISYFSKAINEEIIQPQDLEIKKIFTDCYAKIAENSYDEKNYEKSGQNYLKAIEILNEIIEQFPDTNEAFISTYKIPEYSYNAALSFYKSKNWNETIEILNNIISGYPENDASKEANLLLFKTYISESLELNENKDYENSIIEFLKILDLDKEIQKQNSYIFNNQKRTIFSNTPTNTLKNIGYDFYNANDYSKALFVYDTIIDLNPDMEEQLTPFIVDSKIKLVAGSDHTEIIQSIPYKSISIPEQSRLHIENTTPYNLIIYFKGPEYRIIKLEAESKTEIDIKSGTYKIAAELEKSDIPPFYGEVTYEENQQYKEIYKISEQQ